jgi:hypothetical protein
MADCPHDVDEEGHPKQGEYDKERPQYQRVTVARGRAPPGHDQDGQRDEVRHEANALDRAGSESL